MMKENPLIKHTLFFIRNDAEKILKSAEAVHNYLEEARRYQEDARKDLDSTEREATSVKTGIQGVNQQISQTTIISSDSRPIPNMIFYFKFCASR